MGRRRRHQHLVPRERHFVLQATAISNAGVNFPQGWPNVVIQRQERVKMSSVDLEKIW